MRRHLLDKPKLGLFVTLTWNITTQMDHMTLHLITGYMYSKPHDNPSKVGTKPERTFDLDLDYAVMHVTHDTSSHSSYVY